jgi:hypothetical protein
MNIKANDLNRTASRCRFQNMNMGEIFSLLPAMIHGLLVDVQFESFLAVGIIGGK